jgi:hypothetical protein
MRATSPASAQTLAVHTARDVGEPDVRPVIGRAAVAAAVAGNALEFYDFVIYAYFAVYIGRAFFRSVASSAACCSRPPPSEWDSSPARSAPY